MYHAVSTAASPEWGPWQYALTPMEFEQQISWLSQHCSIVSLDTLVTYLCGEATLPENAVVLTFDDGYRDFTTEALPVLQEYDAPATLYISTAQMTGRSTPYEFRLARTLQQSDELTIEIDGDERTYRLSTATSVREAYAELRPAVENVPAERRGSFLDQNGMVEYPEFRILSPEMVREVGEEPLVTIGSHAHVHRRLQTVPRTEVAQDVRTSRSKLSALLDDPPDHFSFPYGSHSEVARQAVESAGFESAVTTESRLVKPRDWHRCYTLPRIDMAAAGGDVPPVLRQST